MVENSLYAVVKIVAYIIFDLFDKTDILVSKRHRMPLPGTKLLSKEDLIKSISRK